MKMTEAVSLAGEIIRGKKGLTSCESCVMPFIATFAAQRGRELVLVIIFTLENILRSH